MKFPHIEEIKRLRNKYIMMQRVDKAQIRFFQKPSTKSTGLCNIARRDLNNRREKLKLIEIILRQHNELKKLYGSKK